MWAFWGPLAEQVSWARICERCWVMTRYSRPRKRKPAWSVMESDSYVETPETGCSGNKSTTLRLQVLVLWWGWGKGVQPHASPNQISRQFPESMHNDKHEVLNYMKNLCSNSQKQRREFILYCLNFCVIDIAIEDQIRAGIQSCMVNFTTERWQNLLPKTH